ncbi:recombination-associated protein RdgC [Myxococcota bacterium]|nr:recombination-associated protein RdgC [Myxococcota bacterium]
MGILTGNISYRRYFVEGELPPKMRETFLERVQMYTIPVLDIESEEEQAHGWATTQSVLDTEFTLEKLFFNEYMLFTFRVDAWKLPTSLIKAYATEEERNLIAEEGRDQLTRKERKALREEVRLRLKRQLLPTIATYDVCWHPDQGVLRFWNHSNRTNELFVELFEKTFGLHLVMQSPYTLAQHAGLEDDDLQKMIALEPLLFAHHSHE